MHDREESAMTGVCHKGMHSVSLWYADITSSAASQESSAGPHESLESGRPQKAASRSQGQARPAHAAPSWPPRPLAAADLVIHKKKVTELRSWLQHCQQGLPGPRLLVLTGAWALEQCRGGLWSRKVV